MDDTNSFAAYSPEPTTSSEQFLFYEPTPAPTFDSDYTYQPTTEVTPFPTYTYERRDDDSTPLMRAYATIGFIIRIFLPIILIVMCCRIKRRQDPTNGGGGGGRGGANGNGRGGFANETQMDPEERRQYVAEKLCTKVSAV